MDKKDKNRIYSTMLYYGIVQLILIGLEYVPLSSRAPIPCILLTPFVILGIFCAIFCIFAVLIFLNSVIILHDFDREIFQMGVVLLFDTVGAWILWTIIQSRICM